MHQEVLGFPIMTNSGLWKGVSRIRNPMSSTSRVSCLRWSQCTPFFVLPPWRLHWVTWGTNGLWRPERIKQFGHLVSERNVWEKMRKIHKWNEFGTWDTIFCFHPTQIICVLMDDYEEPGVLLSMCMPCGNSPGKEWLPLGGGVWLLIISCVTWQAEHLCTSQTSSVKWSCGRGS